MQIPQSTPTSRRAAEASWLLLAISLVCFTLLYYLPTVMYGLETAIDDDRVGALFKEVLASPHARIRLINNAATHLVLLIAYFSLLWNIAIKASKTWNIKAAPSVILTLILGWTFLVASNAVIFNLSTYTFSFPFLASPVLAISLAALFFFATTWLILGSKLLRNVSLVFTGIGIATICLSESILTATGATEVTKPNIIIIGVDSFSHSAYSRLADRLPTMNKLMTSGTSYERAYTPLGRTFPAWLSILSGKQPAEHGAIFNLRNMDFVEKSDLISSELNHRGFRTIFAMDERRFNNIDEAFGFDEVVGPEAGALDFAVQQVNDTPLTNLLLQTKLAKWSLPFSYTNTASVTNYDADAFVQNTLDASTGSKPLFLAVHFESAHFPFETRHAKTTFNTNNNFWNKHAAALTVIDRQIAQLLSGLKQQGRLNDALVILLSDHGESLGYQESTLPFPEAPNEIQSYGHGTSVVSDHQNHVILAVDEFRDGLPITRHNQDTRQVSLMDLRPTIERFIDDGIATIEPTRDCLFSETDLRFGAASDYRTLDPAAVAASTAAYYEIDDVGRLRLREDRLQELVSVKDFGLRCLDHVTFFSDFAKKFFTISLDAKGLPVAVLPVNQSDVARIKSYQDLMVRQLTG